MVFVDTNVLLYAFAVDRDPLKSELAKAVITDGDTAFSIQVFQEFYVQATHSKRVDPLTSAEVEQVIEALSLYPVQENTLVLFKKAMAFHRRFKISFWDASILATADCLSCPIVLSEDLNHQQQYGGVKVDNPFLAS